MRRFPLVLAACFGALLALASPGFLPLVSSVTAGHQAALTIPQPKATAAAGPNSVATPSPGAVSASSGAGTCAPPPGDSDTEYAGDNDPNMCSAASSSSTGSGGGGGGGGTYTGGTTGPFPVGYFAPDFSGRATKLFSQQFIAQAGSYLEVTYPAGSSAPSSGKPGGAQAQLPLAVGPVDNATLTYEVRFPVGFTFVKGGKLPGLCGGACYTGGKNGQAGWSARFMWRTGGAGEAYVYSATTKGYGDSLGRGSWTWAADGNWHRVSQHVHMNTPGVADGTIDVSIDGVPVSHDAGIEFRVDGSVHIDSLLFSTFYGGHDSSWAPPSDQHLDFQTFHLTVG